MSDGAPAIVVNDVSHNPAGNSPAANTGGAGAPNTAGASAPSAPTSTPTPTDWTASLDDDAKGYVTNKGFKTPADVLKSYRNAETLLGVPADNVLKLPTKDDDADGWNKVYGRLGRPEKADDYKIPMPEKGGDENFAKWAKETFHKHGLTAKQAEKLATDFNQYAETVNQNVQAAEAERTKFDPAVLKNEWGMAHDKNMALIDRAAHTLGIKDSQLLALRNAMGPTDALRFMYNVASKLGGEDSFVGGGNSSAFGSVLTPNAALNKIAALKQDTAYVAKLAAGDTAAIEEFTRLHQMAHPDPVV